MITNKQRAKLKGIAVELDPIVHIGKEGITDNILVQIDQALKAREILKGTIQQNADLNTKEVLSQICEKLNAEPVLAIGRKFVLYRESEKKIIKL